MVVALPLLLFHFSKSFSSFQVEYHILHNIISLSFLLRLLCAPTAPHALGNYASYWDNHPLCGPSSLLLEGGAFVFAPWRLKVLGKFCGVLLNWLICLSETCVYEGSFVQEGLLGWVTSQRERGLVPWRLTLKLGSREWGRR